MITLQSNTHYVSKFIYFTCWCIYLRFHLFDKYLAIIVCSILTQSNITSDFKRFAASVNNIQCLLKLLLICAFVSFPSRCSNHNNMRLILVTFITIVAIVHGVPPIDPSAKTGKYYIHSVCSISYYGYYHFEIIVFGHLFVLH